MRESWGKVRTVALTGAWWCVVLLLARPSAGRADFYVAINGSDANPGTRDRPFATLEAARQAVRDWKREGAVPAGGITIWMAGGDYRRSQALELTAEDSGAPGAPVVWRPLPGATVRWLGGTWLRGFAAVTDPAVLGRLAPEARAAVRQLDLRTRGLTNLVELGGLVSRGFGRPTAPAHPELFFAGRPMTLARWPNEGSFERLASVPADNTRGDDHGGKLGELTGGFRYSGDRPRRWHEVSDLWVHGYWAWDWANSYERVASLDVDARWIRTAPPHGLYGFREGQRFYFLNVLEELDQPGEWHLDRPSGILYFWPPEPLRDQEVLLSLTSAPLVRFREASQVVLQGLVLEGTRGSAVEIRGGVSNRVESCVLRNLGNYGVVVEGGHGHGVVACDVFDTGDGGVTLQGGDRQTLTPGGHYVENCHFQRQGRWSKCYVPAILLQGVGLRAAQNLIHDHPHCAILFGGNDHLIELNEIHHVALETGDVGAIYAGRDYTFRGNRVVHNYLHDIGGVGMGSMGVYLDDCVSGVEVRGNLFHQVQRAAFLGGGRDHVVENNVFVDCRDAVELDGRGLDPSKVWRGMVDDTMRRRLADVPAALYRERYPALKTLDPYYEKTGEAFSGIPPEGNVVARNVCVGRWLHVYWHAQTEMLKLADNLVTDRPGFVGEVEEGAPATVFDLRTESPAWGLGFRRIPVERIGLQPDARREALPVPVSGGVP